MTSTSARVDGAVSEPLELTAALLRDWPLPPGGDKFTRGTVLVIGGSLTTPGAVLLAGEAALRMGAGRLQIATAGEAAVPIAVTLPEAAVWPLDSDEHGTLIGSPLLAEKVGAADAVLLGPGLAPGPGVSRLLDRVIEHAAEGATVLLDAAAIGALGDSEGAAGIGGRLILTPNDHELAAALPGDDEPDAATVARRYGATVTCFGTVTSASGVAWRVPGDQPGLGTSGSGDVLAGFVAGAAARGATPDQAACWGTYAHMQAARALADQAAPFGFIARELMRQVPMCLPADAFAPPGDR